MGLGIVLLSWAVVGTVVAAIGAATPGWVTALLTRGVTNGRRTFLETVEQGTFRVPSGTCPLEEMLTSKQWPAITLFTSSDAPPVSRRFQLSVETYHGWIPSI
jgi:hypothetical protein